MLSLPSCPRRLRKRGSYDVDDPTPFVKRGGPGPASLDYEYRRLGIDAFDIPIHRPQTGIVNHRSSRDTLGAGIVDNRTGERVERTIDNAVLDRFGGCDDIGGDLLVIRPYHHFAGGNARPAVIG